MKKEIVKSAAILFVVVLSISTSRASPAFSSSRVSVLLPVNYTVEPVAVAPLTDINASIYGIRIPGVPSPAGETFKVEIHLRNATATNVPGGVAGIEVHFDISTILDYAGVIGFTNMLGTAGGVLNTPLLYSITPGFYEADGTTLAMPPYTDATQFIVAAASSGDGWNNADGLVCILLFMILAPFPAPEFDVYKDLNIASDNLSDPTGAAIPHGEIQGTLRIDYGLQPVYPPRPYIFIDPASKAAAMGQVFTVDVKINASEFWDVAGYDVTVGYNSSILTLLNATEGGFLKQGGASTYGYFNNASDSTEAIFTKTNNPVPSSGVDTLFTLQFNVTCQFSHQPLSCNLQLSDTILALWSHPTWTIPPWDSPTSPVLPYDPRPVPPALPYTHYTISGTFSVNLGDINDDGVISLQDLVAFAQTYGSKPPNPNYNERADLAQPFEQIGLTDLVTFAVFYNSP